MGARNRGRVEISRTTSRAEHPDWSLLKIGETCQRRWDVLGEEAKAPYVELAQTDAKRYKAEAAAYLAKM